MACQKSDCLIVVKKPVKAGGAKGAASSRSQRGSSDGTRGRKTMEQETKGIRYQSEHYPAEQGLMGRVNEQSLMAEHRKQSRRKATGIDSVDKAQYDENAKEKAAIRIIEDFWVRGVSFTQETALSGHRIKNTVQHAKNEGYYIRLFYVGLDTIEECERRIKNRSHSPSSAKSPSAGRTGRQTPALRYPVLSSIMRKLVCSPGE